MAQLSRKIINDPVYGFITLDHDLLLNIVAHPYYQRLRRIHQMAFAHLVYPGAVHTRHVHFLIVTARVAEHVGGRLMGNRERSRSRR